MTSSSRRSPAGDPAPGDETVPGGGARPWAMAGLAYAFGVVMLGTTLPTPLYPMYQRELGFGSLLTTVIYAVYAAWVIAALVLLGRASDAVGRRPMLFAGLVFSLASAAVFVTDAGLPVLFAGRVLSGISAGIFTGTATAALVDLAGHRHQKPASVLASAVNMLGLGCGPLLAGLLAAWAPQPLRLPYLADLVLVLLALLVVWLLPETRRRTGGLPAPRWPTVPAQARAVFVPAAVVAFAAFSVFGLLTAIEPIFLGELLGLTDPAPAGALVFAMFAASAGGQVASARLSSRVALPTGCVVLVAGLAGVGTALATASPGLLIAGTIAVGLGHGVGFSAGMAAVTAASPPEQRARAVSAFFVVAYVGISVPVVLVGLATSAWGLLTAGITFTAAVALVTLAALIAVLRLGRRPAD